MPSPTLMPAPSDLIAPDAKATGTAAFSKFMAVLQLIADAADAPTIANSPR